MINESKMRNIHIRINAFNDNKRIINHLTMQPWIYNIQFEYECNISLLAIELLINDGWISRIICVTIQTGTLMSY